MTGQPVNPRLAQTLALVVLLASGMVLAYGIAAAWSALAIVPEREWPRLLSELVIGAFAVTALISVRKLRKRLATLEARGDITVGSIHTGVAPVEPSAEAVRYATDLAGLRQAYQNAGFTRHEALEMVRNMQTEATRAHHQRRT
jgi:hypothetical protein